MNDEDKPLNQQGQESHLSDPSVGGEIFFELRGTKLKLKFSRGGNLGLALNIRNLTNHLQMNILAMFQKCAKPVTAEMSRYPEALPENTASH